jgi:hypothetical protein
MINTIPAHHGWRATLPHTSASCHCSRLPAATRLRSHAPTRPLAAIFTLPARRSDSAPPVINRKSCHPGLRSGASIINPRGDEGPATRPPAATTSYFSPITYHFLACFLHPPRHNTLRKMPRINLRRTTRSPRRTVWVGRGPDECVGAGVGKPGQDNLGTPHSIQARDK